MAMHAAAKPNQRLLLRNLIGPSYAGQNRPWLSLYAVMRPYSKTAQQYFMARTSRPAQVVLTVGGPATILLEPNRAL
jgi:hypothetical protein